MPLLDKLREQYGVGPLCSELHIAPSTYYHCQQQRHHPDKRSARAQRDDWLKKEIQRVYDENHKVYGVRKVWRQLLREGIRVATCTVARLMAVMGLAGVLRGKKVRTTISRKAVAAGDRGVSSWQNDLTSCGWLILLTSAHGGASSMWRSSLMCLPDTSWGGGSHRPWKRHSCWMHWSRRYGPVDRPARSITVIKVLSMYRWPTHSGLRKPDYWHQQEVQATRMTTRWRRASMVFTKRR